MKLTVEQLAKADQMADEFNRQFDEFNRSADVPEEITSTEDLDDTIEAFGKLKNLVQAFERKAILFKIEVTP